MEGKTWPVYNVYQFTCNKEKKKQSGHLTESYNKGKENISGRYNQRN